MQDNARPESPLAQFLAAEGSGADLGVAGVRLRERPFCGHLNLRGDPDDPAFLNAVEGVLEVGLPARPNTVTEGRDVSALWLGPDEWLLITRPGLEAQLALALRDSLSEIFAGVTDISGGQTVINIQGGHARDVLAKGCTLDLHPRAFGPGRCAQTLLASVGVIVRQLDTTPSFDLIVRRSFAEYLGLWLKDAAQDYGLAVHARG